VGLQREGAAGHSGFGKNYRDAFKRRAIWFVVSCGGRKRAMAVRTRLART
jgi:hypothetical protein